MTPPAGLLAVLAGLGQVPVPALGLARGAAAARTLAGTEDSGVGIRPAGGELITEAEGGVSGTGGGLVTALSPVSRPEGELGRVATTMSSMSSLRGLSGLGVLAPLLASVLQLSSLRTRPR